jgi:serine/threonine protein kinase
MAFPEANIDDQPTRSGVADDPAAATRPAPGLVRPGEMLDQYRIVARLGYGGMGEVFKAVHTSMERIVALKVLAPNRLQDARALARFKREVKSAGRLNHPNIVTGYDAAQDRGLWFLVMEFVPGTDLARCVADHGRPPPPLACEIIRQAALGLQHAHEKGMVHRDLKPANLMVSRSEPAPDGAPGWPARPVVKILDFGLARLQYDDTPNPEPDGPVTREGTVIGTPEFMSPEQATDSRRVDIRSDIYGLGCTLYYLLAGRPPFVKSSLHEVLASQLRDPPPPLSQVRPDIHPGLAAVVHRMLAKRPEDRFQTPAEVARALKPWSESSAAPSPVSATVHFDPPAVSSPHRETPRSGPALPTAPGEALGRSVGWFGLGLFIPALFVLFLALVLAISFSRLHPNPPVQKEEGGSKQPVKDVPGREEPRQAD